MANKSKLLRPLEFFWLSFGYCQIFKFKYGIWWKRKITEISDEKVMQSKQGRETIIARCACLAVAAETPGGVLLKIHIQIQIKVKN